MNTITVYKNKRLLECLCDSGDIFSCGIGLGPSPVGHKTSEGDGRTPEGRYTVCTRNAQSKYTLFLGLNYPSAADAYAAYENKLITFSQLQAITAAYTGGYRPPWDTPLGGQIGIHGGGIESSGALADSTAGCIALRDTDIHTLWQLTPLGTPVIILP